MCSTSSQAFDFTLVHQSKMNIRSKFLSESSFPYRYLEFQEVSRGHKCKVLPLVSCCEHFMSTSKRTRNCQQEKYPVRFNTATAAPPWAAAEGRRPPYYYYCLPFCSVRCTSEPSWPWSPHQPGDEGLARLLLCPGTAGRRTLWILRTLCLGQDAQTGGPHRAGCSRNTNLANFTHHSAPVNRALAYWMNWPQSFFTKTRYFWSELNSENWNWFEGWSELTLSVTCLKLLG